MSYLTTPYCQRFWQAMLSNIPLEFLICCPDVITDIELAFGVCSGSPTEIDFQRFNTEI